MNGGCRLTIRLMVKMGGWRNGWNVRLKENGGDLRLMMNGGGWTMDSYGVRLKENNCNVRLMFRLMVNGCGDELPMHVVANVRDVLPAGMVVSGGGCVTGTWTAPASVKTTDGGDVLMSRSW